MNGGKTTYTSAIDCLEFDMQPSIPFDIRHFESLDSTNEEARRLLNTGTVTQPTVIRADSQTAGRGTQGRSWISPPGAGLYFSILHPFIGQAGQEIPLTPLFTLAAGVACAQALQELTGLAIQLKPINDLYLEGRKLGGILTESIVSNGQCKGIITGIGINIKESALIEDACHTEQRGNYPISLQAGLPPVLFTQWQARLLSPQGIHDEVFQNIIQAVDKHYQVLLTGQTDSLLTDYLLYKIPEIPLPAELLALTQ